jgi:hypothetical protein
MQSTAFCKQLSQGQHGARGIALLTTVGVDDGPHLASASGDGLDALLASGPLPEPVAPGVTQDSTILRSSLKLRTVLGNRELAMALGRIMPGADLLLARADLLRVDKTGGHAFLRARTRNTNGMEGLRAVLGVVVLLRLGCGPGEVTVFEASRMLPEIERDAAALARQRSLHPKPGGSVILAFPVAFRPGEGTWLSLAFVRAWIKPDVFMAEALGRAAMDRFPDHVREWCGTGVSLPTTILEFLKGEESGVSGQLRNIYGRGV